MELNTAAKCFAELGHPTRLGIFRLLVKAGDSGLPVGDIQAALDIPASTLSHHIAKLVSAGLVEQQRESRVLRCLASYATMKELITFMTDECCAGVDLSATQSAAR